VNPFARRKLGVSFRLRPSVFLLSHVPSEICLSRLQLSSIFCKSRVSLSDLGLILPWIDDEKAVTLLYVSAFLKIDDGQLAADLRFYSDSGVRLNISDSLDFNWNRL
jgi:hypothetical protein